MIALLLAACTFQPGGAFGRLDGFTADLRFEPGEARDLGGFKVLTDLGAEVQVQSLQLQLSGIELQEIRGAAGVSFDPANPPEGYSLCHGGHCHYEDGSLVSYDQIINELSGGTVSWEAIIAAPFDQPQDLLEGGPGELGLEGLLLPQASLSRLEMLGEAEVDGRSFRWDLPLSTAWSTSVEVEIARDKPEGLALEVELLLPGTLFDGIDFAAMEGPELDPAAAESVVEEALATFPTLTVTRSN